MVFTLDDPRVLICGSRHWSWPTAVHVVLDRLLSRYGDRLTVIQGGATGADRAAGDWCVRHGFDEQHHRCHPVDWAAERRERPGSLLAAGPRRNTRMLLTEHPRLVIAFHDRFDPAKGGTSDMTLRALLRDVPAWLVPGPDLRTGSWLRPVSFPPRRIARLRRELAAAEAAA